MTTERQEIQADIVCVGFGPATAGFLSTLAPRLLDEDGSVAIESPSSPGLPLQVIAFERADGPGFGVSGAVTRARGIRASIPEADLAQVPMAVPVTCERLVYLLDPLGASRRSVVVRSADRVLAALGFGRSDACHAIEFPFIPAFLQKHDGLLLSVGQFLQWVSERVMATGAVQIWPGSPVAAPIFDGRRVTGVRLSDQGTDRFGNPSGGYMPGMAVRAALTVVGDGPVGAVGQQIDQELGLPRGHARRDWALGVKMLVELPAGSGLAAGTVLHTIGYPEPEIFGFLYAHADDAASVGIFVPSWFDSPVRTAYRYLQHWMLHPYLWRYLQGGRMRSWGAKSIQESGRVGEPFLVGDGFARVGEGSGTTNVLTGSGVDEAWTTGAQLAEAVIDLVQNGRLFDRENLEKTYVSRRRSSWVDEESRQATGARNGFEWGLVPGLAGMALAAFTRGRIAIPRRRRSSEAVPRLAAYARGRVPPADLAGVVGEATAARLPLHDSFMDRVGWPSVPFDGQLIVSQQDALLTGGKVQAPPGAADHVAFLSVDRCASCEARLCIEMCSGQALLPGATGVPSFEREKCVHCGACFWNCSGVEPDATGRRNVDFRAGPGGLHSAEN